jgi:recombination protein RecT
MSNLPQLVESVTIEKLLAGNVKKFESILPKHLTPQKLFRLTITEVRKNPDLAKCTTESLIAALLQCAQVGLEIGTNKAYLVPYRVNKNIGTKDKPQWVNYKECQFQIGYKGLIELALRSGKILKIYAQPVFSNEYFIVRYGTNELIQHDPLLDKNGNSLIGKDKGEFIGAYAIAKIANVVSGEFQFDFMTKDEIEAIRAKAQAKSEKSPWNTAYYEMAKKTVAKRLTKYLPSSSELEEALSMDDNSELDFKGNVYDHEQNIHKEETKTEKIKRNLETQKAQALVDAGVSSITGNLPDNEPEPVSDEMVREEAKKVAEEYFGKDDTLINT